jgi:hypothetical protein
MKTGITIGVAACLLVGCATEEIPLVFGQAQTVGMTMAGSAPEQGGEFTFGYRDKNIAVIPTKSLSQAPDANGNAHQDALSVLGQFEVEAGADEGGSVALGKFFATGLAAKTLADGFRCEISKEAPHESCTGQGAE